MPGERLAQAQLTQAQLKLKRKLETALRAIDAAEGPLKRKASVRTARAALAHAVTVLAKPPGPVGSGRG